MPVAKETRMSGVIIPEIVEAIMNLVRIGFGNPCISAAKLPISMLSSAHIEENENLAGSRAGHSFIFR